MGRLDELDLTLALSRKEEEGMRRRDMEPPPPVKEEGREKRLRAAA